MPEHYCAMAVREFERLQRLADRAIAQVPAEAFFATPAPGDNSIAIIVKHVGGNLRSRWTDFLTSDGEKPDRDRDAEFELNESDTRASLLASWAQGWAALFGALGSLGDGDLGRLVTIRGESLTVLQAINRQLTHYAYHVGQIVFLAKHFVGGRWASLSIPRGQSALFNQAPAPYLPSLSRDEPPAK